MRPDSTPSAPADVTNADIHRDGVMTKKPDPNDPEQILSGHPPGTDLAALFELWERGEIIGVRSWRDLIAVHPAANEFPMMPDAELAALGKDIVENRLKERIALWSPDRRGGRYFLLDGRNRLEAIWRAISDPKARERAIRTELITAKRLYGDVVDPYGYVISINLHRRHLTRKKKRDLIEKLLKTNPERSDREIARLANADHEAVGRIRAGLESTGGIRQLEKTVGADGRARPVRRSAAHSTSKPKKSAQQLPDIVISDFSKLLHRHPAETLSDLTRLLANEPARIAELPRLKRIELARGYLRALGLGIDDLTPGVGA